MTVAVLMSIRLPQHERLPHPAPPRRASREDQRHSPATLARHRFAGGVVDKLDLVDAVVRLPVSKNRRMDHT